MTKTRRIFYFSLRHRYSLQNFRSQEFSSSYRERMTVPRDSGRYRELETMSLLNKLKRLNKYRHAETYLSLKDFKRSKQNHSIVLRT